MWSSVSIDGDSPPCKQKIYQHNTQIEWHIKHARFLHKRPFFAAITVSQWVKNTAMVVWAALPSSFKAAYHLRQWQCSWFRDSTLPPCCHGEPRTLVFLQARCSFCCPTNIVKTWSITQDNVLHKSYEKEALVINQLWVRFPVRPLSSYLGLLSLPSFQGR